MLNRLLLIMFVVLGTTATAGAKYRRARTTLVPRALAAAASNHGAKIDSETGAGAPLAPLAKAETLVEAHSARVENDLMLFPPNLIGITPPTRSRNAELFDRPPPKRPARFFAPTKIADDLELRRERDRMLLFHGPQPQGQAVALGLVMFGATTILSARAPRALRILFDGPVHLGPAVFDGGGMGAGIAGRGL